MTRSNQQQRNARLRFYLGAIALAVVVWVVEVHMQNRLQVYGPLIDQLNPLQEKQLGAFLEMNRLLITLGTALLGALGFFLVSKRRVKSPPRELWAAFGSAVCVGLSLYFGYRAYEDIVGMFEPPNPTFDLAGSLISWDRNAHFATFLMGVFFFADFAFHELSEESGHEPARDHSSP